MSRKIQATISDELYESLFTQFKSSPFRCFSQFIEFRLNYFKNFEYRNNGKNKKIKIKEEETQEEIEDNIDDDLYNEFLSVIK